MKVKSYFASKSEGNITNKSNKMLLKRKVNITCNSGSPDKTNVIIPYMQVYV